MIIVFGSMNIDMILPVDRFPHPGETVLCSADYLSRPGGKGSNQAMAAAKAGAKVAMVGKVGDDGFGRRSVANLKSQSIWTAGVGISDRPTGCSTIGVDRTGANIVMVAPGANLDATADQVPDEILIDKNIVLAQMEVTAAETFAVLERAHALGATTILNASPAGEIERGVLAHIDYLIVNEIEAEQLARSLSITQTTDTKDLCKALAQQGDFTCIMTMEGKGSLAARGNDLWHVPALRVDVVDTTGAGDAFCGIFAACLQKDLSLEDCLHRASLGASLSCLGLGAQSGMPFLEDIEGRLNDLDPPQKIS